MPDLRTMSALDILALHAEVLSELRERRILRSANNPTGDLAEHMFCKAFGWRPASNSNAHVDAIGENGARYQIKARRLTENKSRQLSALRDLEDGHFDVLAAVLFSDRYAVVRAALVPHAVIVRSAKFIARTNSHKFHLTDDVWGMPGVQDVTRELRAVQL